NNPQHPYTQGLLACRPPIDKKLLSLPTMIDFVVENEKGDFVGAGKSIDVIINERLMPEGYETSRRKKLYSQQPILKIEEIKTSFPIRKGLFGSVKEYVKAV